MALLLAVDYTRMYMRQIVCTRDETPLTIHLCRPDSGGDTTRNANVKRSIFKFQIVRCVYADQIIQFFIT